MMNDVIVVLIIVVAFGAGYFIIAKLYDVLFKNKQIVPSGKNSYLIIDDVDFPADLISLLASALAGIDFHSVLSRSTIEDFFRDKVRIENFNYDQTLATLDLNKLSNSDPDPFAQVIFEKNDPNVRLFDVILSLLSELISHEKEKSPENLMNIQKIAKILKLD